MTTLREMTEFDLREILPLYAAVGWTNYTDWPEMLEKALRHSLWVLGAYDGGKLVGLLRAVGDGFSVVLLQDILVLPEYQRQGIGRALMHALMENYPEVYQMELFTDDTPKTAAFYESLGFTLDSNAGCRGFMKV